MHVYDMLLPVDLVHEQSLFSLFLSPRDETQKLSKIQPEVRFRQVEQLRRSKSVFVDGLSQTSLTF